jgi:Uma2 family endonuclease
MSERAERRMTVAEFLRWDDGTDIRYELVGGLPVAMAPPLRAHRMLSVRLAARLEPSLPPQCSAEHEAGIARPEVDDACYIADLVVSCTPTPDTEQLVRNPLLIIEILSPSTANFDRQVKVPEYRRIASVAEILLIDSRSIFAEVQRRADEHWLHELVQGPEAILTLVSVGLTVQLGELYRGLDLAAAG